MLLKFGLVLLLHFVTGLSTLFCGEAKCEKLCISSKCVAFNEIYLNKTLIVSRRISDAIDTKVILALPTWWNIDFVEMKYNNGERWFIYEGDFQFEDGVLSLPISMKMWDTVFILTTKHEFIAFALTASLSTTTTTTTTTTFPSSTSFSPSRFPFSTPSSIPPSPPLQTSTTTSTSHPPLTSSSFTHLPSFRPTPPSPPSTPSPTTTSRHSSKTWTFIIAIFFIFIGAFILYKLYKRRHNRIIENNIAPDQDEDDQNETEVVELERLEDQTSLLDEEEASFLGADFNEGFLSSFLSDVPKEEAVVLNIPVPRAEYTSSPVMSV